MRRVTARFRKTVILIYAAAVAFMVAIILMIAGEHWGYQVDFGLGSYVDTDGQWEDESGETVMASDLKDKGDNAVIYYTLPQMQENTSLVYRSQNTFTQVYLGEELIYETDMVEHHSFRTAPGSRWNIVTFSPEQSGMVIKLQASAAYEGEGVDVDHIYWGDRADILLSILRGKLVALTTSFAICLCGLFMAILDLPLNYGKKRKNHNLLHLGVFSLCIGLWCLMETNVLQFVVKNTQIIQNIDNMLLIVMVLPLLLYADCVYGIFRYLPVRLLAIFQLVFFGVCIVVFVTGVSDWHRMLPVARAYLAVCAVGFMVWAVVMNVKVFRKKSKSLAPHLQIVGIGALGVSGVLELVRFHAAGSMDKAMLLRFGLLAFIICFAVSSQFRAYQLITQGMEYNSVRKLAYSDVLTQLNNRTAYLERLEECVKAHVPKLGIVYMDVNNLKKVNDELGHDAGDILIQTASEVIRESFAPYGSVYRIGGDEFCALLENDPEESYAQALDEFQSRIRQANDSGEYSFHLQIAQGFACCEADSMKTVEDTIKTADEKMYQNKIQLKAQKA